MNNKQEDKIEVVESSLSTPDDSTTVKDEQKIEISEKQDKPENLEVQTPNKENSEVLLSTIRDINTRLEEQTKINEKLINLIQGTQNQIKEIKESQIQVLEDDKAEVQGYYDQYFDKGCIIRTNERAVSEYDSVKTFFKQFNI